MPSISNVTKKSNNTSKTTKTPAAVTKNEKVAPRTISQQQIAERAYGIYLSGRGGTQVDHWLQAERELKTETQRSASR